MAEPILSAILFLADSSGLLLLAVTLATVWGVVAIIVWVFDRPSDGPESKPEAVSTGTRTRSERSHYNAYLQTSRWQQKRRQALNRAGHRCQLCGRRGDQLEVHHNSYDNLGDERPEDLVVLCRTCHRRHHRRS